MVEVELTAGDLQFSSATIANLSTGANRLIIGSEVVQFAIATQVGPTSWALRGLLRGRGGTEHTAQTEHPAGTGVTLIDESLVLLDPANFPSADSTLLAAIGRGDDTPVRAQLENSGITSRPLPPVHPRVTSISDGSLQLRWTRRARGAWEWPDEVETPLIEQSESYRIGVGPVSAPVAVWQSSNSAFLIDHIVLAQLTATHLGAAIWVRQVGSYAQSEALRLTTLG